MPHEAPTDTNAMLQQAVALQRQGKLAQAGAIYLDILASEPDHPDCLNLLGILVAYTKNYPAALELIDRAIAVYPHDESFHNNRGNVLREMAQFEQALASHDRAIAIAPRDAGSHFNRGVALQDLNRPAAAIASYDNTVAIDAHYAHAWYNRGNALQEIGDFAAAVGSYDKATSIDPRYAQAYGGRGNALTELGRFDAAIASFDHALLLDPSSAESYCNRGIAQKKRGLIEAALASFDDAVRLRPDYPDARWNKALALLLLGDLRAGWELYETRWQTSGFKAPRRDFKRPLWLGNEPLAGKAILLHNDQGLGDAIQFSRYATLLNRAGARVVLEVSQPLVALLRTVEGVADVIHAGAPLPDFDFHCPLSTLPLALGTDMDTVPAAPAYLHGDIEKAREWHTRLGNKTRPRIGLVVSGNPHHANDANRSVGLGDILPCLPEGVDVVLMQTELRDADKAVLAAHPEVRMFGEHLADFTDTAALCGLMDVVISVDTSVAHLAGAMGRKTWILLSFLPDWRWLLGTSGSRWYPSATLYRQSSQGAWAGVFRRVGADLRAELRVAVDGRMPGNPEADG